MKPAPRPPHWARWLLTQLHSDDTLEEVSGDLDELYTYCYERAGRTQATLRYLLNVVSPGRRSGAAAVGAPTSTKTTRRVPTPFYSTS